VSQRRNPQSAVHRHDDRDFESRAMPRADSWLESRLKRGETHLEFLGDTVFWVGLLQIIGINIVLSGDNAVVIALACRSLPPALQKKAIFWGSAAAIIMRVVLTLLAVELLRLPYLKLAGAVLLLWIGIKLLVPEDEEGDGHDTGGNLMAAIKTVLIADLVMSLDNVLAVAAAAKGSMLLLIIGLLISIPLIIVGATLLIKLMERFPVIIVIGAGLIGWVAGEMTVTDPSIKDWIDANAGFLHTLAPAAGVALVIFIGKMLAKKAALEHARKPAVDISPEADGSSAPDNSKQ
jgi:YjbE family integral membrane protein